MMSTDMKVTELGQVLALMGKNKEVMLREPDGALVGKYAEAMKEGASFPPIVLGKFPHTEKYGSQLVVDGVHRILAAQAADLKSLPVHWVSYKSVSEMLADMYVRNMAHGMPVTEGQRNTRIKLLLAQGMTLVAIGKIFQLGKSSIDRIGRGEQGEGKSGKKAGTPVTPGPKKPKTAAGIYKMIQTLNRELSRKRPNTFADMINYLTPASEDESETGEVDETKVAELLALIAFLQKIVKEAQ